MTESILQSMPFSSAECGVNITCAPQAKPPVHQPVVLPEQIITPSPDFVPDTFLQLSPSFKTNSLFATTALRLGLSMGAAVAGTVVGSVLLPGFGGVVLGGALAGVLTGAQEVFVQNVEGNNKTKWGAVFASGALAMVTCGASSFVSVSQRLFSTAAPSYAHRVFFTAAQYLTGHANGVGMTQMAYRGAANLFQGSTYRVIQGHIDGDINDDNALGYVFNPLEMAMDVVLGEGFYQVAKRASASQAKIKPSDTVEVFWDERIDLKSGKTPDFADEVITNIQATVNGDAHLDTLSLVLQERLRQTNHWKYQISLLEVLEKIHHKRYPGENPTEIWQQLAPLYLGVVENSDNILKRAHAADRAVQLYQQLDQPADLAKAKVECGFLVGRLPNNRDFKINVASVDAAQQSFNEALALSDEVKKLMRQRSDETFKEAGKIVRQARREAMLVVREVDNDGVIHVHDLDILDGTGNQQSQKDISLDKAIRLYAIAARAFEGLDDQVNLRNAYQFQADALMEKDVCPPHVVEHALELYTKARYKPGFYRAHVELGYHASLEGRSEAAIDHFRKALEINPKGAPKLFRGQLEDWYQEGIQSHEEEGKLLARIVAQGFEAMGHADIPASADSHPVKHLAKALKLYHQVVQTDTAGTFRTHTALAYHLSFAGRSPDALQHFKQAVACYPTARKDLRVRLKLWLKQGWASDSTKTAMQTFRAVGEGFQVLGEIDTQRTIYSKLLEKLQHEGKRHEAALVQEWLKRLSSRMDEGWTDMLEGFAEKLPQRKGTKPGKSGGDDSGSSTSS